MTVEATPRIFRDRVDAGRALGAALAPLGLDHPVVLGLPRGGVPVAYEVARALDAPLDEPLPLEGCTAVVVDDGLATGATAMAGLGRCERPAKEER